MLTLNDISPGQTAVIRSVATDNSICRRLQDIGLVPGTIVRCVGQSPMGDPVAFVIRGAVIAIRREDCGSILIN